MSILCAAPEAQSLWLNSSLTIERLTASSHCCKPMANEIWRETFHDLPGLCKVALPLVYSTYLFLFLQLASFSLSPCNQTYLLAENSAFHTITSVTAKSKRPRKDVFWSGTIKSRCANTPTRYSVTQRQWFAVSSRQGLCCRIIISDWKRIKRRW